MEYVLWLPKEKNKHHCPRDNTQTVAERHGAQAHWGKARCPEGFWGQLFDHWQGQKSPRLVLMSPLSAGRLLLEASQSCWHLHLVRSRQLSQEDTRKIFFGVCSLPDGEPLSTPSSYWESKHPTSFLETKERNLSCKPMPRHGLSLRACVLPTIASFSSQTSSPEFHQGGLFHLTHLGWLFFFFCLEMFL